MTESVVNVMRCSQSLNKTDQTQFHPKNHQRREDHTEVEWRTERKSAADPSEHFLLLKKEQLSCPNLLHVLNPLHTHPACVLLSLNWAAALLSFIHRSVPSMHPTGEPGRNTPPRARACGARGF